MTVGLWVTRKRQARMTRLNRFVHYKPPLHPICAGSPSLCQTSDFQEVGSPLPIKPARLVPTGLTRSLLYVEKGSMDLYTLSRVNIVASEG